MSQSGVARDLYPFIEEDCRNIVFSCEGLDKPEDSWTAIIVNVFSSERWDAIVLLLARTCCRRVKRLLDKLTDEKLLCLFLIQKSWRASRKHWKDKRASEAGSQERHQVELHKGKADCWPKLLLQMMKNWLVSSAQPGPMKSSHTHKYCPIQDAVPHQRGLREVQATTAFRDHLAVCHLSIHEPAQRPREAKVRGWHSTKIMIAASPLARQNNTQNQSKSLGTIIQPKPSAGPPATFAPHHFTNHHCSHNYDNTYHLTLQAWFREQKPEQLKTYQATTTAKKCPYVCHSPCPISTQDKKCAMASWGYVTADVGSRNHNRRAIATSPWQSLLEPPFLTVLKDIGCHLLIFKLFQFLFGLLGLYNSFLPATPQATKPWCQKRPRRAAQVKPGNCYDVRVTVIQVAKWLSQWYLKVQAFFTLSSSLVGKPNATIPQNAPKMLSIYLGLCLSNQLVCPWAIAIWRQGLEPDENTKLQDSVLDLCVVA